MKQNEMTKPKTTRQEAVDRLLTQLPAMDREELLKLWHDLFDRIPSPALHRGTLIPILAYRIQEKAFGGLKESTLKRLHELAKDHANDKKSAVQAMIRPKIGTRYVREYRDKLHEVTVLETGYEYQGRVYRSLTEIAKAITGTKWSGPVFFDYKRPGKRARI
jgi:Protein of unknown function (DUF2924)